MTPTLCHIIVAAGSGRRFGAPLPKQFLELKGKPVLMHTVAALRRATPEAEIILVLNPDFVSLWHEQCEAHGFVSPPVVAGGATRYESVRNGLSDPLTPRADIISVHDGARPLPSPGMVRAVVGAAMTEGFSGALPGIQPTDSLRVLTTGGRSEAVDRSMFRAVQTPQAFPGNRIREAYAAITDGSRLTDDASVVEAHTGLVPVIVDGDPANIKITHGSDLALASMLIDRLGIPLP